MQGPLVLSGLSFLYSDLQVVTELRKDLALYFSQLVEVEGAGTTKEEFLEKMEVRCSFNMSVASVIR
jgi:hypothetical protein